MSLRVLVALVSLIVVGTGLSVRSYLRAAEVYAAPSEAEVPGDGECGGCPGDEALDAAGEDRDGAEPAPPADAAGTRPSDGGFESAATTRRAPVTGSGWVHCPGPDPSAS